MYHLSIIGKTVKKIAFVTDVTFWRNSAGCDLRINQIVKLLSGKAQVSLFYIGKIPPSERKKDCFRYFSEIYEIFFWKQQLKVFIKDCVERFAPFLRPFLKKLRKPGSLKSRESVSVKDFVDEKIKSGQYDVLWVEYVWLTYLFDSLPSSILKVVDTHDVQYDRCESFEKIGGKYDFQISKEEEIRALDKADYVLAINHRDYETLHEYLHGKVIEYPYLPSSEKVFVSNSKACASRIAFIGSAIDFNIKSINWFLTNVWPTVLKENPDAELHVYGKVSSYCKKRPSVYLHGFVEKYEDIYETNQIFINPILMGGGLKIKCVEALMYGKPLVTTTVGAQGLENGINTAFLVADGAEECAVRINALMRSKQEMDKLSENAVAFISGVRTAEKNAEQMIENFL